MKKVLKKMGMFIGGFILLLAVAIFLFLNLSPEFGASPSKSQWEVFKKSENYRDGVFINNGDVKMNMGFNDMMKSLKGFFGPQPNSMPGKNVTVQSIDSLEIVHYRGATRLIWFGHSAFLLQIEGKQILIDPMFGAVPAPASFLGSRRFSANLPIEVEKLPKIDAVILSHDHYDHLDYGSIQLLKDKVGMFYVPLGVGSHLEEWGIESNRIVELDWWQEIDFEGLNLKCAPAQHFSGRGLADRGKTLWSSWVIQSRNENIFFSGDSGYGPHFKEIGEKYGPFDFAMMECGQYNELWKEIHMMPEETAQAGIDVRAETIMPIHWGAFKLAMHPWTEPVERLSKKAKALQIHMIAPRIGESIVLGKVQSFDVDWWTEFN
ncbi:MBL fold metallo-hydrolase [Maribacter halichondriae]|uniref:MBL fold metallo-hydrolase n=1 Tax=Maribacter halichondriae TaxID=2980554 RepID=UPI0023598443|nr:MBL fold metallo-hydrolase [Maribacter sp. Hal144]